VFDPVDEAVADDYRHDARGHPGDEQHRRPVGESLPEQAEHRRRDHDTRGEPPEPDVPAI